jgi:probable rRNA maturation factor
MASRLDIAVTSRDATLRVPRRKIDALVRFVVRAERAKLSTVEVAVVDARQIARFNRRYLRHAGPTDVLSFDLTDPDEPRRTVQIVLSGEVARRQARRQHQGLHRELLRYLVHGLLHELGYDDQTPADAQTMHARQEDLLRRFFGSLRKDRPQ